MLLDRLGVLLGDEVLERPVHDGRRAVGVLEDLARDLARAKAGDFRALRTSLRNAASCARENSSGEIGISSSTCVGSSCFSVVADTVLLVSPGRCTNGGAVAAPRQLERKTRFELATLALARRCSTAELLPQFRTPSYHERPGQPSNFTGAPEPRQAAGSE